MLIGILNSRHIAHPKAPTGPLPITPEWQRRQVCERQAEQKRRLDALLADASVFRQEHDEHD